MQPEPPRPRPFQAGANAEEPTTNQLHKMSTTSHKPHLALLFQSGGLSATPGIMAAFPAPEDGSRPPLFSLLDRHFSGDWGDLDAEDKQCNEDAIFSGARIVSAYQLPDLEKIYIITDGDDDEGIRHSTTIMFASEY